MPSIYQLKPLFQNQLRPLVNQLASKGVTPNQITISGVILSSITGGCLFFWPQSHLIYGLIPFILALRMALNAIDGMLAREHHLKTSLGAILNELGDVVADAVLYLPFAVIRGVSGGWVVTVVTLSIISEMAGVLGVTTSGQRRYDGPMGKSDRAFAFSLVCLSLLLGVSPLWLDPFWIIVTGLLIITIINRVAHALENLNEKDFDSNVS